MNIAYFCCVKIPSRYASAVNIFQMINSFLALGYGVHVFNPNIDHDESSGSISKAYDISRRFLIYRRHPFIMFSRWRVFAKHRYLFYRACLVLNRVDLLYIRDQALPVYGDIVLKLKIPFIFEAHLPQQSKLVEELISSPYLLKFVVISNQLKTEYLRIYPNVMSKVEVHHDAANPSCMGMSSCRQPKEVDPITNKLVGGYIGNLYPGKCMETLVTFAKDLEEFAEFKIFGGSNDDILHWKAYVELNDIKNIFFEGYCDPSDIKNKIKAVDFFVAPFSVQVTQGTGVDLTRWMSPLKIFEYMAACKPIIASDLMVIREVLTNNFNAILCSPENPVSWIAAVKKIRDDPMFGRRIASQAYCDWLEKYTWNARAEKILLCNESSDVRL